MPKIWNFEVFWLLKTRPFTPVYDKKGYEKEAYTTKSNIVSRCRKTLRGEGHSAADWDTGIGRL